MDNIHVIGIVIVFCMVQSVFGMGLLIFGTPTLIILGVPFFDCLIHLIPASLTISLLQTVPQGAFSAAKVDKSIPILILAVAAGLMVHLLALGVVRLDGLIGFVLLSYGVARMFDRVGNFATELVRERHYTAVAMMGVLHGVSNMGGAILAIMSSARYSDKTELRDFVAINYAILAGTQLFVLLFAMENKHVGSFLVSSIAALFVYLGIGKHMFQSIASTIYKNLFTAFIFAYSLVLLIKYFLSN
ncbi:MAG: hypothetical protein ACR2PA_03875 [Hyphomicrobiaceae bacterium]